MIRTNSPKVNIKKLMGLWVCSCEKTSFKMLGLTFSSKLDWGSYNISIAKIASKKIGTLIHSMKLLSPEVALCAHAWITCYVWAGAIC